MHRSALVVLCFFTSCTLAQAPQAKPGNANASVPTKTFTDPAVGVSFVYPAVWSLSQKPSFYLPPSIVSPGQPPQAIVSFSPAGNLYAKTNLGGLEFTYVRVSDPSEASCRKRVTQNVDPALSPPQPVTINGTQFFHIKSEDAGMCHQAARDIYETYRNGSCLLFEAAFYTTCPDPEDGKRQLTSGEISALSRHLDAIIGTVRIAAR